MWYGQDVMLYFIVWDDHVFLKLSATSRSLMVVSLLHKMQAPNNCFTLSLCDSNSCKSNSWRDDHVTTHWYRSRWWRSWCRAGDDRDHDSTLEMEIKGARWSWPYHVTYFDCIWCLSFMHLIFLSTTVALWDDPLLKFQGRSVLPEYAPLRALVLKGGWRVSVSLTLAESSVATPGPCEG